MDGGSIGLYELSGLRASAPQAVVVGTVLLEEPLSSSEVQLRPGSAVCPRPLRPVRNPCACAVLWGLKVLTNKSCMRANLEKT